MTCPHLDSLLGIALYLERDHPDMALALREAAQELRETRGLLRLANDLLADSIANTEALLNDERMMEDEPCLKH